MQFNSLTPLVLLATTLFTFVNLTKYAKAKDWNGVLTILLSILAGVGAVALAAHSSLTDGLVLVQGGARLGVLDGGALVMLGIAVGTTAPAGADLLKSIDGSRTSAKPPLVGPADPQ